MINLKDIERVYFLGIGGIGMSALARYFLGNNFIVAGYDRNKSEICCALEQESCEIQYQDQCAAIPDSFKNNKSTLIVYTPAISSELGLFTYFKNNGYHIYKRAEVLGHLTKDNECIAIAGTHGKTTISSLLSYVFTQNFIDCSAFLGGIAKDFNSNIKIGKEPIFVVEADEFDRSFLHLSPDWAIISSMDADHLDVYGSLKYFKDSFDLFSSNVSNGNVIAKEGLDVVAKHTYALNSSTADFSASKIMVENGRYLFDIKYPNGVCNNVSLGMSGIHNVENALAVFSMAYLYGVCPEGIVSSLASFSGVKRRFEYHLNTKNQIYIDDYAHHPEEIKAVIKSSRDLFPEKLLTVVFQPHLFSRTRDFMTEFAEALSLADKVMLLDIYPARELPIKGISSEFLLEKITCVNKGLYQMTDFPEVVAGSQVLMTLGAGSIDLLVQPIKNYLSL